MQESLIFCLFFTLNNSIFGLYVLLLIRTNFSFNFVEPETYSLSYMTPDAMLFFGNLPLTYQTKELAKLASSYGVITRCLVIHSKMTKKSKGYGFVEYVNRNHAMQVCVLF